MQVKEMKSCNTTRIKSRGLDNIIEIIIFQKSAKNPNFAWRKKKQNLDFSEFFNRRKNKKSFL